MSDSDSLLSDSDDEIDIVAQANKAKAAFESAPAKPEAVEEVKEEEVGNASAAAEAKNLEEEAGEAAKQEEEEAERLAAEAREKEEAERLAAEAREKEEAERLAAEAREKEEAERLAAEAKEKEEAEKQAAEAREKEEAERLEKEEAARLAAEEEEKRQQEEEERKQREAEEERKRQEAEQKQREAEEQKRKEEEAEQKRREEEERKKQAAVAEEAEKAAAESAEEEEEAEEDEEEADEPKEANAEEDVRSAPRLRTNSTMHDLHSQKIADLAEKDHLEKLKAKENMQKFTTIVNPFQSEAEKAEEKSRKERLRRKTELANRKADYQNQIEDGERRLTEYKALRKKGKKKKAWKPLMVGYVCIVNSPFKMKKGKAHKVTDGRYFIATQLLPQSCNIDETEAEWTKNKRSDSLCPALIAFSSQKKYDEFAKKVAGKNMKDAAGLMALAQYATGLCHLKEDFALGHDVATAIANLKTDFIRTEAVLPVDSFRGGDSGEDNQFVVVDRKQAFVFSIEDEEELSQWQEKLKSMQPEPTP